jgi:CubicO group peptidase (beta-lactamase class C family)
MEFPNLTAYMNRLVEEFHVPGVDCTVYQGHKRIFRYFTGVRDLDTQQPMTGDELYIIFSMTKMLTCTCALQHFDKGLYAMSDPVSKFLPEFARMRISSMAATGLASGYAQNPITVKDLFTMGAGLDYDLQAAGIQKALLEGKTSTRELVSSLSETVLGFEPGTRYRYSLCHDVLGALVEIWSGQSLGQYMNAHILSPLGMKNTFFGVPKDERLLAKMVARYTYTEDKSLQRLPLECPYNFTEQYESGGAGLISTAEDYAIFLDAMANGGRAENGYQVLKPSTIALMGTNHLNERQLEDFRVTRPGYGYGLGVRTHMDRDASKCLSPVGEFGWDGAAGGFAVVDPKNKISLTYFQEVHRWDIRMQTQMRNALYTDLSCAGLLVDD